MADGRCSQQLRFDDAVSSRCCVDQSLDHSSAGLIARVVALRNQRLLLVRVRLRQPQISLQQGNIRLVGQRQVAPGQCQGLLDLARAKSNRGQIRQAVGQTKRRIQPVEQEDLALEIEHRPCRIVSFQFSKTQVLTGNGFFQLRPACAEVRMQAIDIDGGSLIVRRKPAFLQTIQYAGPDESRVVDRVRKGWIAHRQTSQCFAVELLDFEITPRMRQIKMNRFDSRQDEGGIIPGRCPQPAGLYVPVGRSQQRQSIFLTAAVDGGIVLLQKVQVVAAVRRADCRNVATGLQFLCCQLTREFMHVETTALDVALQQRFVDQAQ